MLIRYSPLRRGMTLAELLVAGFLMTLFGVAAVGSLNLALRQQNRVAAKVNCLQNARFITSVIATELKTAIPNQSTQQGWTNISVGGVSLSTNSVPPGGPTAVQTPNMLATSNNTLIFMEPCYTTAMPYNPMNTTWTPLDPRTYQRVRYFCTGVGANVTVGGVLRTTNTTLSREVVTYDSAGAAVGTPTPEVVATGAAINVTYTALARNLVQIDVICGESPRRTGSTQNDCTQKTDPAYRTTCFIVGE